MTSDPNESPESIGSYRLIEVIGEGGMGIVYKAEQTGAIHRTVALKLIKAGMDSKQVITRFEAERQALAMMDHPGIATVHDAGTTESGRPFFVMEFVDGLPITAYCTQHRLPLKDRLGLFMQVCEAVHHAHQKGIIHRDLKPSNVIVIENDRGAPIPKVIDFGIAKATLNPLTDRTLVTNFSQILGTPAYMSPEQADLSGWDVDTRTDIYALGVMLYELITGHLPIDEERLANAAFAEMQRLLWEEEPPRPSKRLTSLGGKIETVSETLGTTSAKLIETTRGDLDWIVMTAMDKDRTRRYASANGFVEDLERFLQHQPVHAAPPTTHYLIGKFVRRHRVGVTTAFAVGILLFTATAISLWQTFRAMRAQSESNQHRDAAEATLDFLRKDLLAQASPSTQPDRDIKLRAVVDRAAERLEDRFADQPLVKIRLYETLGTIYTNLGEGERAQTLIDSGLALADEYLDEESHGYLTLKHELGSAYQMQNRYAEALAIYDEVIAARERVLGPVHRDTLAARINRVYMLIYLRDREHALPEAREVYALSAESLPSEDELTFEARRALIQALYHIAERFEEAMSHLNAMIERFDKIPGAWNDPMALGVLDDRGNVHRAMGNLEQSAKDYEQELRSVRRIVGPDHLNTIAATSNLGGLLVQLKDFERGLPLLESAYEDYSRIEGETSEWTMQYLRNLAGAYLAYGDRTKGMKRVRELLMRSHGAFGNSFHQTLWAFDTIKSDLEAQGRHQEIEALLRDLSDEEPWPEEAAQILIARGSSWRYHTAQLDSREAWRKIDFKDGSWPTGKAPFGYGEPEVVTLLENAPTVQPPLTAYFRQRFQVDDPEVFGKIKVRVRRDDSVAVFLNGTEIVRHYLPSDEETSFQTLSTEPVLKFGEPLYYVIVIDPDLLRAGENVLAGEVHQHKPDSSDLFFDLQLEGLLITTSQEP